MLMPARVVATLTDAQTRSVRASASGSEAISARVAGRHAFVHERREAAEEVHADLGRRAVEVLGEQHVVVARGRSRR